MARRFNAGEIGGSCRSGYNPRRVCGEHPIVARAPEQTRGFEHRIDRKRAAVIVASDYECNLAAACEPVAASNPPRRTVPFCLIQIRSFLNYSGARCGDHQVAIRRDCDLRTRKLQSNALPIGARCDHKIILETALGPIQNQVDAAENIPFQETFEMRDVADPAVGIPPDQVRRLTGASIERLPTRST